MFDPQDILIRINPAGVAMLRCPVENCIGKKSSDLFKDQPALLALLSGDTAHRIPLPDRRVAQGIFRAQTGGGRLVLLRDITERDDLESRRVQLSRAIAHDLNNPISAIEGFVDLVAMYGPLTPEQQRFNTRIRQTIQKIQKVIRPLVDLAWIEAGMPMDRVPVQLDRIIQDVAADLADMARLKHIVIAISAQQPMPTVMGDAVRLRQVVYNLVHNAILYSQPEQSIAIHAFADEQQIHCSVADQGIGIAEHDLGHVFDRLYRAEAVRDLPGGGIGLTLAREIVKRHGGTIHAESTLGQGSTFVFTLPVA